MSILIKNIVPILKARTVGNTEEAVVDTVSIDDRSLQNSANTLFFALVGPNNDAHTYIKDLIVGCRTLWLHIQKDVDKANFLIVENTLDALQQFAISQSFSFSRYWFNRSNGKTVKDGLTS
jgi:alanine racemase